MNRFSIFGRGKRFCPLCILQTGSAPTQISIRWVPGGYCLMVRWPRREATTHTHTHTKTNTHTQKHTHTHLILSRLRMRKCVGPLPHMPSCYSEGQLHLHPIVLTLYFERRHPEVCLTTNPQFLSKRLHYSFSFCNRARFLIYILKSQLFALKYALKHSLIKTISTPTCFGLIRPSSGSCRAWLLSYLEQITFVLSWLCSSMPSPNLYDMYLLLCVQCRTPDDGQRYCPKHVESYSKNEFEKLVLLNLYDIYILLCVQCRTPDDGQRYCPKHVESYSKNKFEKLLLLNLYDIYILLCVQQYPDDG